MPSSTARFRNPTPCWQDWVTRARPENLLGKAANMTTYSLGSPAVCGDEVVDEIDAGQGEQRMRRPGRAVSADDVDEQRG
jgi:hypothetical protein